MNRRNMIMGAIATPQSQYDADRDREIIRIAAVAGEPLADIQDKCRELSLPMLKCVCRILLHGAPLDDAISRTKQIAEVAKQSPMSFDEVAELALLSNHTPGAS